MATKYAKVTLQMKFIYRGNKVFQYFIVVDTKMKKFVLQNQYSLSLKFEEIIEQHALSLGDDRFTFISRRDEDDRVSLEFSSDFADDAIEKRPSVFFTIVGEIPCSSGCEECKFRNEMFCEKKQKDIQKMLQSCKFFSQKNDEREK